MSDDLNDLNATLTNPYGALFAAEDIKNPYHDNGPEMTMSDLDAFVVSYNTNGLREASEPPSMPGNEIRLGGKNIVGTYIKSGDNISGRPFPVDSDGITRHVNFIDCSYHPNSDGIFVDCTMDGHKIPSDIPISLWDFNRQLERDTQDHAIHKHFTSTGRPSPYTQFSTPTAAQNTSVDKYMGTEHWSILKDILDEDARQ